jgi:hypothetical protein
VFYVFGENIYSDGVGMSAASNAAVTNSTQGNGYSFFKYFSKKFSKYTPISKKCLPKFFIKIAKISHF